MVGAVVEDMVPLMAIIKASEVRAISLKNY